MELNEDVEIGLSDQLRNMPIGVRNCLDFMLLIVQYLEETCCGESFLVHEENVGYFTDYVLMYKRLPKDKYYWRLLDCNCLEKRITNEELPVILNSYFKNFCSFKNFKGYLDYVVYTNRIIDSNATNWFRKYEEHQNDILGRVDINFKCIGLTEEAVIKLQDISSKYYKDSTEQFEYKNFLQNLRLLTYNASSMEIELIRGKLKKESKIYFQSKRIVNILRTEKLAWFLASRRKEKNLLVKSGTAMFNLFQKSYQGAKVDNLMTVNMSILESYNITFKNHLPQVENFLTNAHNKILLLSTKSSLLTSIKVLQFLKQNLGYEPHQNYIFLTLRQFSFENVSTFICNWLNPSKKNQLLVLEYDGHEKKEVCNPLEPKLTSIIRRHSSKKIVVIATAEYLKTLRITHAPKEAAEDINVFNDFSYKSQQDLLNSYVILQGKGVLLGQLLDDVSANSVLDPETLEDLVIGQNVEIGICPKNDKLYIQRTLRRQVVNIEKCEGSFFSSNLVFISGANERDVKKLNIDETFIKVWPSSGKLEGGCGLVIHPIESDASQIYRKLCESRKNQNVYWFSYNEGIFMWEYFNGSSAPLLGYLEDYPFSELIKAEKLVKSLHRKTNIIVDYPGFGKSTFINHLSCVLKNTYPFAWVIEMDLSKDFSITDGIIYNYCRSDTMNEVDDMNILAKFACKNNFQKQLLSLTLNSTKRKHKWPEVIILCDGFDELIPTHQCKVIKILKTLRNKNIVQLWITSRCHEKNYLENELIAPAYRLNPFTENQKIEYLKEILKYEKNDMFNQVYYAIDIVFKPLEYIYEAMNFTSFPLHLKMLVEIFMKYFKSEPTLNICLFYKKFVKAKFEIYYNEKAPKGGLKITKVIESVENYHQWMALMDYIPCGPKDIKYKITDNELFRIGLLIPNEDKLEFIHPSLKEYFFSASCPSTLPFINNILDDKYKVTRIFLNDNKNVHRKIVVSVMRNPKQAQLFLYQAIDESNKRLAEATMNALFDSINY